MSSLRKELILKDGEKAEKIEGRDGVSWETANQGTSVVTQRWHRAVSTTMSPRLVQKHLLQKSAPEVKSVTI